MPAKELAALPQMETTMISFPSSATLADLPAFSEDDVLQGTSIGPERPDDAGCVRVSVDGIAERLCIYGLEIRRSLPPLIYLEGDCSQWIAGRLAVFDGYTRQSPYSLQQWAEQIAVSIDRTFVYLARPGVYGSSGNHQQRRRPREVLIVDAALNALKQAFGWTRIDIAGFSGGGHLVAALMAERSDFDCAVIASGNVSVRQRNREQGREADITGYTDFVDPIGLVSKVATHPPRRVIVLTDRQDKVVSASCQTAYVEALRATGVVVEHRLLAATEPRRHFLREAALLAVTAASTTDR